MSPVECLTEADEERLVAIIADCMERQDQGETVDRSAIFRQYPNLAEPLKEYFDSADLIDRLASSVSLGRAEEESASLAFAAESTDATGPTPRTRAVPSSFPRLIPTAIGRYEIIDALGHGGMGTVYLARDTKLDRKVALKLPQLVFADDYDAKARFLVEARAAAQVRHRHICRIYDYGEINETPYYTMELIEGERLTNRIGQSGFADVSEAVSLVITLARAMQQPHETGILHRDLKPANIIIDEQEEPVIVDFGLAHDFTAAPDTRLTDTGVIIGTIGYVSPEQIAGSRGQQGPGADIWSLGIILHELLTGRLPFRGTRTNMIAQILRDPAPAPSTLRPDVPPELDAICLKMLAHHPEDRYASMIEVAEALEAYHRQCQNSSATALTFLVKQEPTANESPTDAAVIPSERTLASSGSRNRKHRVGAIAALAILGLALASTAITVSVQRGTQVVTMVFPEDLGDDVEFFVDGNSIHVETDTVSCRLRHGEHNWVLTQADGTVIKSDSFQVGRDGRNLFEVRTATLPAQRPPVPDEPVVEWQLPGHRGGVRGGIEFLTAGNVLAVGGEHAIRFWDVTEHALLQTLPLDGAAALKWFDLHPNNKDIVISGPLKVITVNRDTGIRREVVTRQERVSAPAKFSPDGVWLAFAKDRTTITLAKADTLEEVHTLPVQPDRGGMFQFSPDSKILAAASHDASVTLFNVDNGEAGETIKTDAGGVSQIAFHQNGRLLALACGKTNTGHRVQLWDLHLNKKLRSLEGHADRIDTLSFSPNGSLIATGSQDNTLRLWNTKTGKELYKQAQSSGVDFVAFDASGRLLAVAAGPGASLLRLPQMVPLADVEPGPFATLAGHLGSVRTLAFSSDGENLYSAGGDSSGDPEAVDSNVRVWDLKTLQNVRTLESRAKQVNKLRLSSDGKTLAAFGDNRTFQFWNPLTGDRLHDFDGAGFGVIGGSRADDFDFLAGGQLVLVGPAGHTIVDTTTLETVRRWRSPEGRLSRVATTDQKGQVLSGALESGRFRLWNSANATDLASFTAPSDNTIDTLAMTPDGRYAVSGSDSEYTVWDIAERRLLHTWLRSRSGSSFNQSVAAITGDGSCVLTASRGPDGHRLVLLDVRTGDEVRTFAGHTDAINAIAVSPDGQFAATGSNDRTVRVWKLPPPPNPDRVAANWVLSIGGSVALKGVEGFLTDVAQLPDGPFAITGINLKGNDQVTNVGLAALQGLPQIFELRLINTPVTDTGLRHLSDLRSLRLLHLTGTRVTGPGLAHLKNFDVLQHLELEGCHLAADALSFLTELANLRTLNLSNTNTTDAMLQPLKRLPLLTYLILSKTQVTDNSVETLAEMRSLSRLECSGSGITEQGLKELKTKRPDVRLPSVE